MTSGPRCALEPRVWILPRRPLQDAITSVAEGACGDVGERLYMTDAWAIVMLYDYHRGVHFAAHGRLALNPGAGPYDFRLARLVEPGDV